MATTKIILQRDYEYVQLFLLSVASSNIISLEDCVLKRDSTAIKCIENVKEFGNSNNNNNSNDHYAN